MSFTSVPVLDLSLASDPATKPQFLADLRHALMEVGFLYLKNVGISNEDFNRVIEEGKAFFDIPEEEKLKIEMKNAPSFLGYSRLSAEVTAGATDHREQIDLSTEHPLPPGLGPLSDALRSPNQWPPSPHPTHFRPVFTAYMTRMAAVSLTFTSLIAEAIELPADAFDRYFDPGAEQQHKLKVVRYPDVGALDAEGKAGNQGVGPHKDSMLTSYLLQASRHRGLQVQNMRGEWIDCPPVEGTLVVAIGQAMEALTGGVCVSTTHRVLSPKAREGARYSIPFFQGVRRGVEFEELETVGVGQVPERVREERRRVMERSGGRLDDCEFTFRGGGQAKTMGEATFRNRVKSHPDVAERWFPEVLKSVREEEAAKAAAAAIRAH